MDPYFCGRCFYISLLVSHPHCIAVFRFEKNTKVENVQQRGGGTVSLDTSDVLLDKKMWPSFFIQPLLTFSLFVGRVISLFLLSFYFTNVSLLMIEKWLSCT
jgi:hypothetical protein